MMQIMINQVLQDMSSVLDALQMERLKSVLDNTFKDVRLQKNEDNSMDNKTVLSNFISAKRVEGCSERSLHYYESTILNALKKIGKQIKLVTTDDLRNYLDEYQRTSGASKVTVDNIRRILSSFFSWLEEEYYILKSPVRRIHKVKTGKVIAVH